MAEPLPTPRGPVDKPWDGGLPRVSRVLSVCAHPDDESFGLGAVLHALVRAGSRVWVLSLTQGERGQPAGTLAREFGAIRSAELASVAQELGLEGAPTGR